MAEPAADLIEAAEAVLDRHGWNGVTAELIADAAGINRVTLYRRGHNARTLLGAAVEQAAREFREGALGALTHGGTAHDRFTELLEALFDLADQHLALLAMLYDGPSALFHLSDGSSDAAVTRFEYTDPFERILRDGVADGSLSSSDPARDAELVFNVAGWTYVHMRRSHGKAAEEARAELHRFVGAYVSPSRRDR